MTNAVDPNSYFPVNLSAIGADGDGAPYEFVANSEQCSDFATRFGCVEVSSFAIRVKINSLRKEGHFLISGVIRARVVQNCVVSLVPVVSEIEHNLELLLLPETEGEVLETDSMGDNEDIDFEVYTGNLIDIGDIGAVELALLLDPYPRAPGVSATDLEPGAKDKGYEVLEEEQVSRNSPFEVLAALKGKG